MKTRRLLTFLCLALVACSGGGDDGDSNNGGDPSDACSIIGLNTKIIGGETCASPERSAVVRIAMVVRVGADLLASPVCSGTMISSRAVLTATHCFELTELAGSPIVGSGILIGDPGSATFIGAQSVALAPNYTISNDRVFNDLAVMTLQQSPGLPSIPLLAREVPAAGRDVFVYGYGQKTAGSDPGDDMFQELEGGTMLLQEVTPNHLFVSFSGDGTNVCFGDSGGPMIYTVGNQATLVGVVSQGSVNGCEAGDVTTFTNAVSTEHLVWITSVAPDAAIY